MTDRARPGGLPPRPVEPTALARQVLDTGVRVGEVLVVAEARFPSPQGRRRVGVFACSEKEMRRIADDWVKATGLERLRGLLRASHRARAGEGDAMYATGWTWVWTTDGTPFLLWDGRGRLAWQEGARLFVRTGGGVEGIDRAGVGHVHAFLEEAWVCRGVRLHRSGGGSLDVAVARDELAIADPTYDAWNVSADASWARALAVALAAALEVPVRVDEPL